MYLNRVLRDGVTSIGNCCDLALILKCSIIFALETEMQAHELTSSNRTQNQRYLVMINLGVATQAITVSQANQRYQIQLNRIYHSFSRRSIVWRTCVVCNARDTIAIRKIRDSSMAYSLTFYDTTIKFPQFTYSRCTL